MENHWISLWNIITCKFYRFVLSLNILCIPKQLCMYINVLSTYTINGSDVPFSDVGS